MAGLAHQHAQADSRGGRTHATTLASAPAYTPKFDLVVDRVPHSYPFMSKTPPRIARGSAGAIRIGLPKTPLSDVYYQVIRGSWTQLVALFAALFIVINALFAGLYSAQPQSIGPGDTSFWQAFAFSVQTISTIGYGTLAPQTFYAHAIVMLEAMTGMLCFAVVTGLVFAKFSRPRARVLFSQPILFTRYHGQRCLMFRVANARGNEVLEARIRVSVLRPEASPEGHRLRRLYELKLERERTPMFALSWSVMHIIDDHSPLFKITADTLHEENALFVVTLSGVDATLAEAIHVRHLYAADDLVDNVKFVDVMSDTDDGRIRLDFTRFHDIEPLGRQAGE